mmetsp:Transcript_10022/g.18230  ORF Transcript_10022/g.18230 Transcript_10022/m.18230 type:complete len:522 (-) Transcript_10022:33-1598(-)|eukprot:CAMPEP_0197517800 /NCGR_PEP_ID=MMETSP1318-20131121/2879_1 /TAXON_ID=552666 /ORGANISM="Partenskyella glossopodia, Strain RCC365" /LENGTH=521 /DNA_ID=CAMNT_0043067653 /DNA_START=182 /DNA_END=1747 /DNA_ORIENTATION=+
MFDPMLFSPTQFGLGPSSETFSVNNAAQGQGTLYTPGDQEMRLSGPPAASDTITMSAHRSLFSTMPSAAAGGGGLKRSVSSAIISEMDTIYGSKDQARKDLNSGSKRSGSPGPKADQQPLGLRSSSSCPNLQQLQEEDEGDGDKIKKRKARKAEVARQCRKRKKAYIQSLEEKAKALAEQLSALSSKRNKGGGGVVDSQSHRVDQDRLIDKMQKLIDRSQKNEDVTKELKTVVSAFISNSRKRQKTSSTEVQNIRDTISPGVETKFAIWLLHQSIQFTGSSQMFKDIIGEIKLTKTQINKLQSHRNQAIEMRVEAEKLNHQLASLEKGIASHLAKRHQILDQITTKILNPKQTARLLLWVQHNPSCMEVLETVWKNQAQAAAANGSSAGGRSTQRRTRKAESRLTRRSTKAKRESTSAGSGSSSGSSTMSQSRSSQRSQQTSLSGTHSVPSPTLLAPKMPKINPFVVSGVHSGSSALGGVDNDLGSDSLLSSNLNFEASQKSLLVKDNLLFSIEGFMGGDQ